MLRGDDIADLQLRLGSLGFDAGRADGIFGPETERAVADFQRNAGLTSDGVAGPQTIAELQRLSCPRRYVAIGRAGPRTRGAAQPAPAAGRTPGRRRRERAVPRPRASRRLARSARPGAIVLEEHHPDWSTQARHANEFGSQGLRRDHTERRRQLRHRVLRHHRVHLGRWSRTWPRSVPQLLPAALGLTRRHGERHARRRSCARPGCPRCSAESVRPRDVVSQNAARGLSARRGAAAVGSPSGPERLADSSFTHKVWKSLWIVDR